VKLIGSNHHAVRIPVDIYAGDPRETSEALAKSINEFCDGMDADFEIVSMIYTSDGSAILVIKSPCYVSDDSERA
jgi:hypothetical protein